MGEPTPKKKASLMNGHWETIKTVSHLTGWALALILAGTTVTGWFHSSDLSIHQMDVTDLADHREEPGHAVMEQRMAFQDERNSAQDSKIEVIDTKLDRILQELARLK